MALIIETGNGASNSESYASVLDADIYHNNRANQIWTDLDTTDKEASLRKATDFMLGRYRMRWLGRRVLTTQALDWPRVGVVLEDFGGGQGRTGMGSYGLFQVDYKIIPTEVKNACAELAFRAYNGPLLADQAQKVLMETVGPVSVKYDEQSPQSIRYVQVDDMLRVYLLAGGNSSTMKLIRS